MLLLPSVYLCRTVSHKLKGLISLLQVGLIMQGSCLDREGKTVTFMGQTTLYTTEDSRDLEKCCKQHSHCMFHAMVTTSSLLQVTHECPANCIELFTFVYSNCISILSKITYSIVFFKAETPLLSCSVIVLLCCWTI